MYIQYDDEGNLLLAKGEKLEGRNTAFIGEKDIILNKNEVFNKHNYFYDKKDKKVKHKKFF